jgi:hypothetical protein
LEVKVASGADRDGSARRQLEELEAKAKEQQQKSKGKCWRSVGRSFTVPHCCRLFCMALHQRRWLQFALANADWPPAEAVSQKKEEEKKKHTHTKAQMHHSVE